MIQKINTTLLDSTQVNNRNTKYSEKTNITINAKNDVFHKNISFGGIVLPSGEYSEEDIKFVKDKLNTNNEQWKKDLFTKIYENLKANRPKYEIQSRSGHGNVDMNDPVQRVSLGIITLGLSELGVQLENFGFRKEARDEVKKMELLKADLHNMKLKEDVAEAQKKQKMAQYKVDYLKKMDDVKENQLKPKLLDLIQREKEGRPTDMPNCIMISNREDKINTELINWAGLNVNGKFSSLENGDNILEALENAEENYQNTGDWNLIYVKNMDKLINHNEVDNRVVDAMKDIMSATAEDYHTTLIFSSTHPEMLDKIALQSHRVKKIDTTGIATPETLALEDAKERIYNIENAKNTPISIINDLLLTIENNDQNKLTWEYNSEQLKAIKAKINAKYGTINNKENQKYINAYKIALSSLV